MKTLGLIGGTSWVSTAEYYRLLNEGVNARLGGANAARCILYSFNFAEVLVFNERQDWDGFLARVTEVGLSLKAAGAEGLVLCANTMHLIADRLEPAVGLPIVHIVDATAAEIHKAGLRSVALLGTRYTMEMGFFRERLERHGIQAVLPDEADRAFIHDSIFEELAKDVFRPETKARYGQILRSLAHRGAQGAILGCTEIPLLIKEGDSPMPTFDTVALHARAAVEFALS